MKPTDTVDGAELFRGDALAILPELPTASVDLVATDPPYSSGGLFRGDRAGRGVLPVHRLAAAPRDLDGASSRRLGVARDRPVG